jgi:hypothetical protein
VPDFLRRKYMKTQIHGELLVSPQSVTASWVDLGAEINTNYYNMLGAFVKLDINSSQNVRIRALAKHAPAGTDEYVTPIDVITSSGSNEWDNVTDHYFEFGADVDQNVLLKVELDCLIPVIQLQVMAETVGATAGQITGCYIVKGDK